MICLTSDHYPYGLEAGDTWGNSRNYLPELYGCKEAEFNKFVQDRNGLISWPDYSWKTDQAVYDGASEAYHYFESCNNFS